MGQRRFFEYLADDKTLDINQRLLGILEAGRYRGFDFVDNTAMELKLQHGDTGVEVVDKDQNTIREGAAIMPQGTVIRDDSTITIPISANNSGSKRIDTVAIQHDYDEVQGGAFANYIVIEGQPGGPAPALTTPEIQVKLGELTIPSGVSEISSSAGCSFAQEPAPYFANRNIAANAAFKDEENVFTKPNKFGLLNLAGLDDFDSSRYGFIGNSLSLYFQRSWYNVALDRDIAHLHVVQDKLGIVFIKFLQGGYYLREDPVGNHDIYLQGWPNKEVYVPDGALAIFAINGENNVQLVSLTPNLYELNAARVDKKNTFQEPVNFNKRISENYSKLVLIANNRIDLDNEGNAYEVEFDQSSPDTYQLGYITNMPEGTELKLKFTGDSNEYSLLLNQEANVPSGYAAIRTANGYNIGIENGDWAVIKKRNDFWEIISMFWVSYKGMQRNSSDISSNAFDIDNLQQDKADKSNTYTQSQLYTKTESDNKFAQKSQENWKNESDLVNGSFDNSWSSPSSSATGLFRFKKDNEGYVRLYGNLEGGANGSKVGQLPSGYRPNPNTADDENFACLRFAEMTSVNRLEIKNNGEMFIYYTGATGDSQIDSETSVSGVVFYAGP